jgi:hypothetical protein
LLRIFRKKIETLRKKPRAVIRKYIWLTRKHLFLLNPREPLFGENYEEHWPYDFRDKRVLDLGGDYGSTAYYFYKKGAKDVVIVEGDYAFALTAKKYFENVVHGWIRDDRQILALLNYFKPDVVKVDIEGAELLLLNLPSSAIRSADWLVEIHDSGHEGLFKELFGLEGFNVKEYKYRDKVVLVALLREKMIGAGRWEW